MKAQASSVITCALPEQVRPLRWWTTSQREVVAAALAAAGMAWRQAWIDDAVMSSGDVADVVLTPGHADVSHADLAPLCWRPLYSTSEEMEIWVAGGHVVPAEMLPILLGTPSGMQFTRTTPENGMAADLARAAWDDLLQHIRRAFAVDGEACSDLPAQAVASLPSAHFLPWSGALHAVLPVLQDLSVFLHIAPGRVAACFGSVGTQTTCARERDDRVQLMAVEQAIASHPERIQAVLTPVEITLGHLQALRVGDVLLLPHPLEQCLQVRNDQAMTLCHAYLGQAGGQRALELIRHSIVHPVSDNT